MDWTALIAQLREKLTQADIAQSVGVDQSTISDLANQRKRQPKYALGAKLIELHRQVVGDKESA